MSVFQKFVYVSNGSSFLKLSDEDFPNNFDRYSFEDLSVWMLKCWRSDWKIDGAGDSNVKLVKLCGFVLSDPHDGHSNLMEDLQ